MHIKPKGFTIVEVLIVLAIVSLILLMILLAVPYLQRSVRDNRRRRDLSRFYNALQEYESVHGNQDTPFVYTATDQGKFDTFVHDYLGNQFSSEYNIEFKDLNATHNFSYTQDKLVFFPSHYCSDVPGEQVTQGSGVHPRYAWAVLMGMEATQNYICLDQGNLDL